MVAVTRASRSDLRACVVLLTIGSLIGEACILRRPELHGGSGFVFGDPGFALMVAREVLSGARLYADIAYQYGALPVYLYAAVARVFGNTPFVYLQFLLVGSLVTIALFYALVRRVLSVRDAFIVTLAGAIPVLLIPGAFLGGYVSSYYIPVERILMLTAAVAWQPPPVRSVRRAIALGACLGMMQLVRFGPGLALAAVVMCADLAWQLRERRDWRVWIRAEVFVFLTIGAIETIRVAGAFAVLPRPVAMDVVWPSYILDSYQGVASRPGWYGWAMGVGQYFNPLTSIALVLLGFGAMLASRARVPGDEVAQMLLPSFYLVGVAGLFRSEFHFFQAAWTLTSGAVVAIGRWRSLLLLAVLGWLPPFALVAVNAFGHQLPDVRTIDVAPGWRLTAPLDLATRIETMAAVVRAAPDRPVIFYSYLAGLNAALDLPLVGRESTLMHGAIRPYEEDALVRAYSEAKLIVTCRKAEAWAASPGLYDADVPARIREAVEPRAESVLWQDNECRIVRLRPAAGR